MDSIFGIKVIIYLDKQNYLYTQLSTSYVFFAKTIGTGIIEVTTEHIGSKLEKVRTR